MKSKLAIYVLCAGAVLASSFVHADILPVMRTEFRHGEDVTLHLGSAPLRVGAEIQTTGYLLLGVLYVAGVQVRNVYNSRDFVTILRPNLTQRPLDTLFERELGRALLRRGVHVEAIGPMDTPAPARWSLRVTQLDVEYVAHGTTASYLPLARARVQLLDSQHPAATPGMIQIESRLQNTDEGFDSFRTLRADPERAFAGLERVSRVLAEKLAGTLVPDAPVTDLTAPAHP